MEEADKNIQPEVEEKVDNAPVESTDIENVQPVETPQAVANGILPENEQGAPAENDPKFEEPQIDYSGYTREQLVEAFRELLQYDISQIRNRVLSIKQYFAEKTNALEVEEHKAFPQQPLTEETQQQAEQQDEISEQYNELYNQYRKKRQKYNQELEAQKQRNLELKNQLLDELRTLINGNDTLKKAHDDFNAIQERWKNIGEVPRSEINNLWNNYHFLIEQFFTKVRINKELRDKDLKANLEHKISICEQTEALIMEPSVNKAFKQLQELREKWRETGPVPSEQNEEIWNRFRNAVEKIDQRRREHYSHMKEEMEQNLLAKTELCEKAEKLAGERHEQLKDWNDKTVEMEDALKLWKSIGPVPREQNDVIWQRFTAAMAKFYENKKEYLNTLRAQQNENYNLKIDLCIKAENLAANTQKEWRKATEELLALQKEWKTIGSVQKKQSEKIWQRFRAACDNFFARKTEFYNMRKDAGEENVIKRQGLIEEMKKLQFGEDNTKNIEMIQALQRQWNETGYTPSEIKNKLQQEFDKIVDSHFEKLKIDALQIASADKHTYISPESARRMRDEIEKMKSEVSVWENNIGFFANSKQATLLKEEFERKIKSAKQKIALLEAKLKMCSKDHPNKNIELPQE